MGSFFRYTFLEGHLIGSENPCALGDPVQQIMRVLNGAGPAAMLTLTPQFERYSLPWLEQYHLPIQSVPTREQVQEAVSIIRACLETGQRVWVHCQHGLDRTGAVIGAYLVAEGGLSPEQAVAALLDRFPARRLHPVMRRLWQPYESVIRSFRIGPARQPARYA